MRRLVRPARHGESNCMNDKSRGLRAVFSGKQAGLDRLDYDSRKCAAGGAGRVGLARPARASVGWGITHAGI